MPKDKVVQAGELIALDAVMRVIALMHLAEGSYKRYLDDSQTEFTTQFLSPLDPTLADVKLVSIEPSKFKDEEWTKTITVHLKVSWHELTMLVYLEKDKDYWRWSADRVEWKHNNFGHEGYFVFKGVNIRCNCGKLYEPKYSPHGHCQRKRQPKVCGCGWCNWRELTIHEYTV